MGVFPVRVRVSPSARKKTTEFQPSFLLYNDKDKLHLPQQPGASLVALAEVPSVEEVGAADVVSGLPAHST